MTLRRFEAAAWLPQPSSPEAHRAGIEAVARWLREQEQRTGAAAVLVTDTFPTDEDILQLGPFQRGSTHFTVKSSGPAVSGPVLAFRPTRKALDVAQDTARSAICVWEHGDTPIRGWAGQVGAVDLTTGNTTTADSRLADYLDRLVVAGTNGYTDRPGLRDARLILAEMRDHDLLDQHIPDALAAYDNLSVEALDRIAKLVAPSASRRV
ncbi:hypothetical protein ACRAKI_22590 [Saccharothrix isguenensis]